jgi:lipopolysaccharide export system protein LptC
VVQDAEGGAHGEPIEFEGEFLHAFLATERLRSHLPVVLRQGANELRVATLEFDNLTRTARLGGPLRARFLLPSR